MDETLVVDNGSFHVKAGEGGEEAPHSVFRTIVGKSNAPGSGKRDFYIGDAVLSERSQIGAITLPIVRGIVADWEAMEKVWYHMFYNELRRAPEEHPILLTESPMNPKANREKTTQMMFETFSPPAMFLAVDAVLALRCCDLRTAVVCDMGHDSCRVIPISDGRVIRAAVRSTEVGGRHLAEFFARLVKEKREVDLDAESARVAMEQSCFVSAESTPGATPPGSWPLTVEIPGQTTLLVESERQLCPEALFDPSVAGFSGPGLTSAIVSSISEADTAMQGDLWSNIVLIGGASMLPGIRDRVAVEVAGNARSRGHTASVKALHGREMFTWLAASKLSVDHEFEQRWISKENYDEFGPTVIHTSCPV